MYFWHNELLQWVFLCSIISFSSLFFYVDDFIWNMWRKKYKFFCKSSAFFSFYTIKNTIISLIEYMANQMCISSDSVLSRVHTVLKFWFVQDSSHKTCPKLRKKSIALKIRSSRVNSSTQFPLISSLTRFSIFWLITKKTYWLSVFTRIFNWIWNHQNINFLFCKVINDGWIPFY